MMRMIEKENGITLIALIITVIVILILAGITISMIIGNNGIITRSNEANKVTMEAEADEKVNLAVAALQMAIIEENNNGNYDPVALYNDSTSNVHKALNDDLKGDSWVVDQTATSSGKINILFQPEKYLKLTENKPRKYKVTIGSGNAIMTVVGDDLASQVEATNYGDYINYNYDYDGDGNINNDWRIFYNDGKNIYIIADDYIGNDVAPAGRDNVALSTNGSALNGKYYNLAMSDALTDKYSNGTGDIDEKFKSVLSYLDGNSSTKRKMKVVAYMLDDSVNVWGKFKNEYADWAIGGPTLDLFVASWNEKNPGSMLNFQVASNGSGYQIKKQSDSSWSNDCNWAVSSNLYVRQVNNVGTYYVIGPSARDDTSTFRVDNNGWLTSCFNPIANQGFRPVICLSSDVVAKYDTTENVWKIQE